MSEVDAMDRPQFAHLHLHSEYSLLDGGNRAERLVRRVKELGMDAVAVTDHGNLHGAVEFYNAAHAAGVKPILGIEAYVAMDDRRDRTHTGIADGGFHLVLLAEDLTGWRNLMKLSSDAYINGFYYKPRMDKSTLQQWSEGLIAINGHLGSSLAHHLNLFVKTQEDRHWEDAKKEALWHARTFGVNRRGEPCFYVELQRHIEEQWRLDPLLQKLARELNLPLVCDNDAHFLLPTDYDAHDTLCCISMGKTKGSTDRLKYPEQLYVKSPDEMSKLFADVPESVRNSCAIAARCNVTLPRDESHAPLVRVHRMERKKNASTQDATEVFKEFCCAFELKPFDATNASAKDRAAAKAECDSALRELAEAGLVWRYGAAGITDAIRARLERELTILADKSISAYFLIVWDFVNWARQQGIPALARGSGVGTMVGYVLGLSNACPERFGLLFERFTDPDRSEYPDIDVDICQDGRARVLEYVRNKYGHVAQIITFGRLKAKQAVKDVARVMGFAPSDGQRLANLVPAELHITLAEAIAREPELQKAMKADPLVAKVLEHAQALEDHARHAGIHAAGVVIATRPLDEIVPLCRASGGGDEVVTQWDGPTCEQAGLLKMDFLGLRTLTTIERCRRMIRDGLAESAVWSAVGRGAGDGGAHPLDLDRIPMNDQRVLDLFRRGDTMGIFQFESGGMRKLLVDMQPDRLEDLIAANALFRPGPMDLIPDFNARKHARQAVPQIHELVDRLTAETYGIMVYQEQIMQVLHQLGGIPLRAAYTVIKAISKKKTDVIESARTDFIAGSMKRGVERADADSLFELILRFAGYGFNKSHSTGYAIVAYQTAYLKTYFPAFYMAAVLSLESQARKLEEWSVYLEDCKRCVWSDSTRAKPHVGVEVRPPDINLSETDFAVVFPEGEPADAWHGHVRFGLQAIRGAGEAAVRAAVAERKKGGPFRDFFDFCDRADDRAISKATLESLVKGGAFDSLHGVASRSALVAAIPDAVRSGQQRARDRRVGQLSMFGSFEPPTSGGKKEGASPLPNNVPPWDRATMLAMEKEAIGFHVSGHPLDDFKGVINTYCTADCRALAEMPGDSPLVLGGVVSRVRNMVSQKGRNSGARMAMLTLSDRHGQVDGVVFPESFAKYGEHLQIDRMVVVTGHLDRSRAEPSVIIERVFPIQRAQEFLATRLEILLKCGGGLDSQLRGAWNMLAGALRQAAGGIQSLDGRPVDTWLRLQLDDGREVVMMAKGLRVVPDHNLVSRLRALLADAGDVTVHGGWIPPAKKPRAWEGAARRNSEVLV